MIHHRSGRISRTLTISRALAFALAVATTSGFAASPLPASADTTVSVHGMVGNKAAAKRPFDPWPERDDRVHRSVDTAFQGDPEDPEKQPVKFIGVIRDRRVLVRDPRTTPRWHDLSSLLPRNFGPLVDISLAAPDEGDTVHVTLLNAFGRVAQSSCQVFPTPGTMMTRAWPRNCTAFINVTPPA